MEQCIIAVGRGEEEDLDGDGDREAYMGYINFLGIYCSTIQITSDNKLNKKSVNIAIVY